MKDINVHISVTLDKNYKHVNRSYEEYIDFNVTFNSNENSIGELVSNYLSNRYP